MLSTEALYNRCDLPTLSRLLSIICHNIGVHGQCWFWGDFCLSHHLFCFTLSFTHNTSLASLSLIPSPLIPNPYHALLHTPLPFIPHCLLSPTFTLPSSLTTPHSTHPHSTHSPSHSPSLHFFQCHQSLLEENPVLKTGQKKKRKEKHAYRNREIENRLG